MNYKRREFLKFIAGGAAGVAALGTGLKGISELQKRLINETFIESGPESWIPTVCQMCYGGCGIIVRKTGNRAVKIEGNPLYPVNRGKICSMGQAALHVLYSPNRIFNPLKRKGSRGSGEWQIISWEEVFEELTGTLENLRRDNQTRSFAILSDQPRGTTKELINRFTTAFGSENCISDINGNDPYALAFKMNTGTYEQIGYDLENAKMIFSFADNLLDGWGVPLHLLRAYGYWKNKTEKSYLVQISEYQTNTSFKADEWIKINPMTKGVLALGIAHVLISKNLYNKDFIQTNVQGFKSFREHVLKNYTPEKVSQITGVPENRIITLSNMFSSMKPSLALGGESGTLVKSSFFDQNAILSLNALMGNFDSQGGILFHNDFHEYSWQKTENITKVPEANEDLKTRLLYNRKKSLIQETNNDSPVKCLYIYNSNPLYNNAHHQEVEKTLQTIPNIVSFSSFLDETSRYSDLIVPVPTFLERWEDDPTPAGFRYKVCGLRQPVLRDDHILTNFNDILIEIAKKAGGSLAEAFRWESYHELLKTSFEELYASKKGTIIGYRDDDLFEKHHVHSGDSSFTPQSPEEFWAQIMEKGGWWNPDYKFKQNRKIFLTGSSKYELHIPEENKNYSTESISGEYPLLLSMHEKFNLSSISGECPVILLKSFHWPKIGDYDNWIYINPSTAKSFGLKEEDEAWLESEKGSVRVKIHLAPYILEGIVHFPFGLREHIINEKGDKDWVNPKTILLTENDPVTGLTLTKPTRVKVIKTKRIV